MKRNNLNDNEEMPKRKQKFNEFTNEEDMSTNDKQEPLSIKEREYIQQLFKEKSDLDQVLHNNAIRLLDQEISKVQSSGKIPPREFRYVNIYREKPIKLSTKVLVPVQDHPKFNFVGKLLGPKGNSLKRLQEETMCKMSILGKGSMRDPCKEQELKNSLDPKYAHLMEELHVEVTAFGPPAEAYARMAFALAEIRKYLIPDKNDSIRQEQLRELESLSVSGPYRDLEMVKMPPRGPPPPSVMRTATRTPVMTPRVMPAKTKILSILDRARLALEESYSNDEPSYAHGRHLGPFEDSNSNYRYEEHDYAPVDYYRKDYGDAPSQRWRPIPPGTLGRSSETSRYRSSNYPRSSSKGTY
ncbi:KH domain-containing, RNA-binding, signal transduction-associated protein 3-like [Coccinella septempunctata]|uniref:KH domain-containing, RNA-binding, signal transduction-associated protein 3-like n=1 Tax=Coccinella septempunctata TaxID=41139 RepID=UPI001D093448|nr:KH domain-containing, RNA-binding, signal transduction-associated protein 3-like [Coccinella septempunctata]